MIPTAVLLIAICIILCLGSIVQPNRKLDMPLIVMGATSATLGVIVLVVAQLTCGK